MNENYLIKRIDVPNEISMDACVSIQDKVYEYLTRGQCRIILNLSQANYVNVHGWLVLSNTARKLLSHGGDLKIWGVREEVFKTCELAGMQDNIRFYKTEWEAMDAFGSML